MSPEHSQEQEHSQTEGQGGTAVLSIRRVSELAEFDRCVELETAVWGYDPKDMIPRRMFLLASRIGGQVLGAYEGDEMVGFAMALPGFRAGQPYLHSHMLGVLPAYRNAGLGRRLKLAQREDALERGFALMEWTFDPLEIRNAYLNICKLGAVVRRYRRDFYGPSSSPLQGGLPTDRVYAEWWLGSQHVQHTLAGGPDAVDTQLTVDVSANIYEWKASALYRKTARQLQDNNASSFERAFARGLAVLGFRRSENGDGRYLLGPWQESYTR